eukprot:515347-Pelagomonas_calceolata.AAC.5
MEGNRDGYTCKQAGNMACFPPLLFLHLQTLLLQLNCAVSNPFEASERLLKPVPLQCKGSRAHLLLHLDIRKQFIKQTHGGGSLKNIAWNQFWSDLSR